MLKIVPLTTFQGVRKCLCNALEKGFVKFLFVIEFDTFCREKVRENWKEHNEIGDCGRHVPDSFMCDTWRNL